MNCRLWIPHWLFGSMPGVDYALDFLGGFALLCQLENEVRQLLTYFRAPLLILRPSRFRDADDVVRGHPPLDHTLFQSREMLAFVPPTPVGGNRLDHIGDDPTTNPENDQQRQPDIVQHHYTPW